MAARKSYASDRRQSGGYSSARSKAGQAYMYGNVVAVSYTHLKLPTNSRV